MKPYPNDLTKATSRGTTCYLTVAAAFSLAPVLLAGTDIWFEPLTESAPVQSPNAPEELIAPWVTPPGIAQVNLVSLREVEDTVLSPGQSVVRVPGLGTGASMFDMIAYDPSGNYLFIPHETFTGAGVSRHDIFNGSTEVLFSGDLGGALRTVK